VSRARILLVDDDSEICDFLATLLDLEGMAPVIATRAEEALKALEEGAVAAILMDIAMPDLDGLELCRRIRARGVDAPILIVSARPAANLPKRAVEAGANEFIRKPFENAELVARLRFWMGQPGP
jgi:DNA-binding response OmpR family regulator